MFDTFHKSSQVNEFHGSMHAGSRPLFPAHSKICNTQNSNKFWRNYFYTSGFKIMAELDINEQNLLATKIYLGVS